MAARSLPRRSCRQGYRIRIGLAATGSIMSTRLAVLFTLAACPIWPGTPVAPLEQGYRQMYDLNFAAAHSTFAAWEKSHPDDPMGPVSDAAAYLFSEFDRLHILQSEFFTEDEAFFPRQGKLAPDGSAERNFEAALEHGRALASTAFARNPQEQNAMLAKVLSAGLHSDYLFLIEKRNLAAFSEAKQGRQLAQSLLALHPDCYDAYLAAGVENYLLSLRSPLATFCAPARRRADRQAGRP